MEHFKVHAGLFPPETRGLSAPMSPPCLDKTPLEFRLCLRICGRSSGYGDLGRQLMNEKGILRHLGARAFFLGVSSLVNQAPMTIPCRYDVFLGSSFEFLALSVYALHCSWLEYVKPRP
jgi:hypothetical protein